MLGTFILHYKIIEKLGEGGMGVVYLAQDTKLERDVSIKFLPSNITSSSDERERFKIEAKAAAALNHPNIATIHAIEEVDDEIFIVMEYIDGVELRQKIKAGQLKVDEVVDIATQVAEGLKAAHDKGIIHRDIKSANIMITETGQAKIMDFGLAKMQGSDIQLTKEHSTLGTAAYMSPEQTNGEDVDHRTDIWSFGVVLYEMLTGEIPFKGDYEQAVIYSILNEEPKSIIELREDSPLQLIHIIEKTLQKDPAARYQKANELIEVLGTIDYTGHTLEQKSITPTIAVLPFVNMSTDKEQDYFCDGIAEDILNELAGIESLHVVARTSSFTFKGKSQDIREIGMKLGANTIVEGSVRKAGNRLRITAQLINVADSFHLWSERYDRELEDVFAIQDEISRNIVQALKIKLSIREKQVIEKVKTQVVQAYDFYLKGRAYDYQGHSDSQKYAIEMYSKAIEKDENYALAYAGLADSYSQLYMYYDNNKENLDKALDASQKALELDPELADAYSSRALALSQNGQYEEAFKEFERAIQLNPKFFEAYYQYARICRSNGKLEQALGLFEKAASIRPEDYEAALFLVSAYNDLKMNTEMEKANLRALDVVRKHLDLNPDNSRALYLGAGALVKAGENEEASQWIKRAVSLDPNEIAVLYNAACIYSELGKVDKALDYFEKAIETGFASIEWIENDSDLDPIRNHPRFQKAVGKLKHG
ncbi:MAG: protein kinase [Candidatus Aminicenantes bacterium]|nr:protein kinase [Candidatus Aminicenantes bacterium]